MVPVLQLYGTYNLRMRCIHLFPMYNAKIINTIGPIGSTSQGAARQGRLRIPDCSLLYGTLGVPCR
jgi:hypothetical protein